MPRPAGLPQVRISATGRAEIRPKEVTSVGGQCRPGEQAAAGGSLRARRRCRPSTPRRPKPRANGERWCHPVARPGARCRSPRACLSDYSRRRRAADRPLPAACALGHTACASAIGSPCASSSWTSSTVVADAAPWRVDQAGRASSLMATHTVVDGPPLGSVVAGEEMEPVRRRQARTRVLVELRRRPDTLGLGAADDEYGARLLGGAVLAAIVRADLGTCTTRSTSCCRCSTSRRRRPARRCRSAMEAPPATGERCSQRRAAARVDLRSEPLERVAGCGRRRKRRTAPARRWRRPPPLPPPAPTRAPPPRRPRRRLPRAAGGDLG